MAATAIISVWSLNDYRGSIQQAITADKDVRIAALVLFAALGFPLAVSITDLLPRSPPNCISYLLNELLFFLSSSF